MTKTRSFAVVYDNSVSVLERLFRPNVQQNDKFVHFYQLSASVFLFLTYDVTCFL